MFTWCKGFGWGRLEAGIFVMVHGKDAPAPADWDACMADLAAYAETSRPRALVLTDGGAPKGDQRAALNRLVGREPPTAVVSDALVTRFIVSSFALTNPSIASFSSREIQLAWAHLRVEGPAREGATAELRAASRNALSFSTLQKAVQV